MEKQLLQVRAFQTAFGAPLPDKPTMLDKDRAELRQKLIQEEVTELKKSEDLNDVADAICDILYIAYGTAHEYGIADRLTMLFDEVHSSNMTKIGTNGKPMYRRDGKVMKPPSYRGPNLKLILNRRFYLFKKAEGDFKDDFEKKIKAISEAKRNAWERRGKSEIKKHLGWFGKLKLRMVDRLERDIKKRLDITVDRDDYFRNTLTITSKKGTTTITDSIEY